MYTVCTILWISRDNSATTIISYFFLITVLKKKKNDIHLYTTKSCLRNDSLTIHGIKCWCTYLKRIIYDGRTKGTQDLVLNGQMTGRKHEVLFRFVKNAPNRIIFLYEPKNKDNKNPTTGVDILGEMCSVVKYK